MAVPSNMMPLGTPAPAFSLPGTDGATYALDSFKDAKVLVVIFTCNHCPYAQAVEERLVSLQRDYADK
ncbi:MAG: redoxin family protein, partial [Myxococcales bacterium]|nr:redoxin family protein [Myxococcales bacterium]